MRHGNQNTIYQSIQELSDLHRMEWIQLCEFHEQKIRHAVEFMKLTEKAGTTSDEIEQLDQKQFTEWQELQLAHEMDRQELESKYKKRGEDEQN